MKASILAIAAATLLGSASAGHHERRHAHHNLHKLAQRGVQPSNCTCSTFVTTVYGEAFQYTATSSTATTTVTIPIAPVVPTPAVTTCPTPGTYTIPATTLTLTETTTVCAATSAVLPSGTHTVGGVTTVVQTSTTVVCPYASVETKGGVETSVIYTTTYVCPSAGTYTIAPTTISPTESTTYVYPVPTSYAPGTYTQPELTVTVTKTSEVVFCPYATVTSTAIVSPVAPTSTSPAQPSSPPSGGLGGGKAWAMTYSPYTSSGQCKDQGAVSADIASIKAMGFNTVRIYSTDCNGLTTVGSAAAANGLKLILGVYIAAGGVSTGEEQINAIVSWAQWSIVELVVIGNEAVFNKWASPQDLAGFIGECKGKLKGAGYNGPVTTTEPVDVLQQYGSAWASVVDVVGAQMHPFFNGGSCDEVGPFMSQQIELAGQSFPGKDVYILETGWPNAGNPNGASIPGPSQQKVAIDQIVGVAGSKACFFSFSDDLWKQPGDYGVEQHWGCASVFQ